MGGDPSASRARKRVRSVVREELRARARAARTDRGMCVSLPFHITSGQPIVGQGVVIHITVTKIVEQFVIKRSQIYRVKHL
ncbi:unnamed protein product [Spirodela intermedia]|uniref:Uncharacterized protein n=1 Tax=Spirodela intermedia TaxID=51605 RepID=A0A7I8LBA4_SPIIN|nr:unnamed protein product [Spirodela intermedia]